MKKLIAVAVFLLSAPVVATELSVAQLSAALDQDCNAKFPTTQGLKAPECLQTIARALKRILDDADQARSQSNDAVQSLKTLRK
ncbi:hypothetical protein TSA1_25595 [Bradyrhizobium nitroreducens]|uniref:Uncharacterized protein n=1 Tax=Bradyrhizobium nitroreducens TaxID=709803 RepID=A0A2M6UGL7_9BRAD|nr:hypothetical protein TSA1_25595 [Bradyrhizobium nitroreducens]